jgi:parvulin-like peptidyl-prolyl isomerase/uncharacterized RDD family membrane protein YckC
MNCPACGNPNLAENDLFCSSCEAYIEKPKYARRAPFGMRFFAYLIDLFSLWGTPIIILYLLNLYVTDKFSLTAIFYRASWVKYGAESNFAMFFSFLAIILWGSYAIYLILQLAKGNTPGKRYFNLRVVKADGSHVDFWTMFVVREIWGRVVSTIPLLLGYFWMLFDKNSQTWHDKIANTLVLQLSAAAVEREKKQKKEATGGIMISLRDNAAAVLFFLVVLFVLSLMFSGGLGGADITEDIVSIFTGEGGRGVLANVNGQAIRWDEYSQYYDRKLEEYRERQGSTPEEGYQLENFEKEIWDEMVNSILISQYIDKHNLQASDEEVVYELINNPPQDIKQEKAFQKDGIFDKALYNEAWQNTDNPQLSQFWSWMELRTRQTLPRQKLNEQILSTVRVSDGEIREEYLKQYQEAKIRYLFFEPNQFALDSIKIAEKDIANYYDKHKDDYKEPEKRKIVFVTFSTQPSREDSALINETATDLLERAKSGEDFAKLAKDNSEDGSAEKGGDLGYFGRGNMIKPFEDAAFGANIGEIVGPVKTQFGLHIIKVEDKKTENNEEKVKASHILLKYKASDETIRLAGKKARYVADRAKEEPFEIVLNQENLQIDSTDFFEAGGFIPKIGQSLNASRYIFKNVIGTVGHPFRYRAGYFIFKIIDGQKERIKTIEEAKPEITNKLKKEKQFELIGEVCKNFRDKMQGLNLTDAALRDSLPLKEPRAFMRKDFVEGGVGRDAAFIGSVFGLENGEISGPVKGVRGYYLIEMVEKKALDEQDLDIKTEQLRAEIMRQKQQRAYTEWFTKLKDEARIKDYRDRYL